MTITAVPRLLPCILANEIPCYSYTVTYAATMALKLILCSCVAMIHKIQ